MLQLIDCRIYIFVSIDHRSETSFVSIPINILERIFCNYLCIKYIYSYLIKNYSRGEWPIIEENIEYRFYSIIIIH